MPRLWLFVVAGAVSACATTPDVSYSYYPVKATGLVSVTQTVDCNSSQTELVALYSPAVTTSYAADYAQAPYTLTVSSLDSPFADTDFGFNLYDDGRLKGINATTTGQAEATAKAAVSLATAAPGPGRRRARAGLRRPTPRLRAHRRVGQRQAGLADLRRPSTTRTSPRTSRSTSTRRRQAGRPTTRSNPGLPLLQVMMNTPVPNRSGARYATGGRLRIRLPPADPAGDRQRANRHPGPGPADLQRRGHASRAAAPTNCRSRKPCCSASRASR